MKRLLTITVMLVALCCISNADNAKFLRLTAVNENIIRVQATPENQFPEKQSLIIDKKISA